MHRPTGSSPQRKYVGIVTKLCVVVAILGGLAGVAIPPLLDAREKARSVTCDNIYVAVSFVFDGEIAQLEPPVLGGTTACGTEGTTANFVECMLAMHSDEDNPRNRNQRAFTEAPITSAESCQVSFEAVSTNGIRFSQYVTPGSTRSRTFSVTID